MPASSNSRLPSAAVTVIAGPTGRQPWLTIACAPTGPPSTTPTAPRSTTRPSISSRVEPGPSAAGRQSADQRQRERGVRLLDEAVRREAVRVGDDDGHFVGVLALGQPEDRHAAFGADHFKMKSPDPDAGQHRRPHADRAGGFDALSCADDAGRAAADHCPGAQDARRALERFRDLVGLGSADEHAGQVGAQAAQRATRSDRGSLGGAHKISVDRQTVPKPRHCVLNLRCLSSRLPARLSCGSDAHPGDARSAVAPRRPVTGRARREPRGRETPGISVRRTAALHRSP